MKEKADDQKLSLKEEKKKEKKNERKIFNLKVDNEHSHPCSLGSLFDQILHSLFNQNLIAFYLLKTNLTKQ